MRFVLRIAMAASLLASLGGLRTAEAQTVQAVLFFAPTCQHCHQVITQYLPTLFGTFGGTPSVTTDETVPQDERCLFLFHNSQLEILLVDASKSVGTELYLASNLNQGISPARSGVPRLVIGEVVLVGSLEIPEQTGGLVQQGLNQGGLEWPVIDGLGEAVGSIPVTTAVATAPEGDSVAAGVGAPEDRAATETPPTAAADTAPTLAEMPDTTPGATEDSVADLPVESVPPVEADTAAEIESEVPSETGARDVLLAEPRRETTLELEAAEPDSVAALANPSPFEVIQPQRLSMLENFRLDPVGNSFSVVVLLFMIASIFLLWFKAETLPTSWGSGFGVPALTLIGAFVASYLTYIEATGTVAVCGPVGDCNTVNQSEYARLLGVVPVGALGLLGYVAIALTWSASRFASGPVSLWARAVLLAMTVGGTLFSVYLTFLEPFIIGATCAWCLTSSVIITLLMWLSAGSGREAWARIREVLA